MSKTNSQTRTNIMLTKSPFLEKQHPLKKPFNISVDLTGVKTLSWSIMKFRITYNMKVRGRESEQA